MHGGHLPLAEEPTGHSGRNPQGRVPCQAGSREAGLIDSERRGTWVRYRLVPAALEHMAELLSVPVGLASLLPSRNAGRR